ncbi:MAG: hypothetical protein AAGC92_16980 [Pseudomonadota bacterium]
MPDTPTTAVFANWLYGLLPAFALAARQGQVANGPFPSVKPGRHKTKGFRAWTHDKLAAFGAVYPVGTKERLIFDIALWTWQARQELANISGKHVRGGMICTTRGKTATSDFCVIQLDLSQSLRIA